MLTSPPPDPALVAQQLQRAVALHQQGQLGAADQLYGEIIAIQPDHFDALQLSGVLALQQGRLQEALALIDRALAQRTEPNVLMNRALVLDNLGRFADALASYDQLLALRPDHAEAWHCRGEDLYRLGRPADALASFERTLALNPNHALAWANRGAMLVRLRRHADAIASLDRALALKPDHAEAWNSRGNALAALKQHVAALQNFDRAIELNPAYAEAWSNRAEVCISLRRPDEARAGYETALALDPRHPFAFKGLLNAALHSCDWPRMAELSRELPARMEAGGIVIEPMVLMGYDCPASLRLAAARSMLRFQVPQQPTPLWRGERYTHDKIRIAYLSADFHAHATAFLMAEMFELHDRSRFETTAISFGPNDGSDMRRRLEAAFDRFENVATSSDTDIAELIREREIDIAIDLKGYTEGGRPGILAHRPAPVQASYLGFPSTMGADFLDYIIADATVLPFDQQAFYSERIVHLPDSYQANDRRRAMAAHTPTRADAGLPEQGFVFCAFNNSWKIAPPVFDIWMRLLRDTPGSVLWLIDDNETARRNLIAEAATRGVDASRLVFAKKLPLDQHLARHRLADLFLDTLPCCAHTTASDALWAGLPLLTTMGDNFIGRVAASLLKAVGLPELAAANLSDYEALARKLAADPALLAGYKARIGANRLTAPLFYTPRLTRNIEAAYMRMHTAALRGEKPAPFAVDPA